MILLEKVKSDLLTARKKRDTATITPLITLVGEVETIAKRNNVDVDDVLITSVCKKFIISNKEIIGIDSSKTEALSFENGLYEQYIPKQLTEDEIRTILEDLGPDNIGSAMKFMSDTHTGRYDGKVAAFIARGIINAS